MIDLDLLDVALDSLDHRSARHVVRLVLATLGSRASGRFEPRLARARLAALTPGQREALVEYCRAFLPAPQPAPRPLPLPAAAAAAVLA